MKYLLTIIVLYILVAIPVNIFAPSEDYVAATSTLMALTDTSEAHGSSFLFMGNVNEAPYYWYYEKEGNYVSLKSVRAKLALIRYTEKEPVIEIWNRRYTTEWLNYIFLCTDDYATIFRVPEGSITKEYNLDLKK